MRCKMLILIYLVSFFTITSCKKLRPPGSVDRKSETILNECDRCKVLTDSYNHWLKKTSRGKYEGGDAAWEEAKLKSYARSEIRLVEIQEGLCSEVTKYQDYCYILSEEADQLLEKWWFREDPNSADLYSWLCIETLKYCCPLNHFGDTCTPCPVDENNIICSGHGECDGNGTRRGNGTCICKRGYAGNNCKDCAENFFSENDGSCKRCHQACNSCSGKGPSACHDCKPGWQKKSGVCLDIDECLSLTSCKSNEICVNNIGSFQCKACDSSCNTCAGLGPTSCTSCPDLYFLWGGTCITKKEQDDIAAKAKQRLGLYIVLLISFFIINHKENDGYVKMMLFVLVLIMICYEAFAKLNALSVLYNLIKNVKMNHTITEKLSKLYKGILQIPVDN